MDRREFLIGGASAALTIAAASALDPQAANAVKPPPAAVLDIRYFGALGDGVSDDTAAIQSAIDTARVAGGGVVWIPAGTFVTSPLTLHGPVTIQGTGWQSILKLKSGSEGPVLSTPTGQISYYSTLRDFAINGNREECPSPQAHGVLLWAADHLRIEGVRISACSGCGIKGEGDSTHHTIAPYITNCYISGCAGSGLHLNSFTYDVKAHLVDVGLCDKGVVIPSSSFLHDVTVWGCNVGFYGYWAGRTHLVNCRSERSKYHGFWLDGCTDTVLEACRAYENNQCQGSYDGFRISGTPEHPSLRISIIGCHSGLLASAHEHQRAGFSDGGSAHVDYILCNGCIATGNHTSAYSLASGANNVISANL